MGVSDCYYFHIVLGQMNKILVHRSQSMKKLIVIMIAYMFFPIFALADVYSWVDARGVKHFSNHPPPSGAQSVQVVEELRSPKPFRSYDEPEAAAINTALSTKKPENTVRAPQILPEDSRQKGNDLILKEQQKLDVKLKVLNQQLADAEQSRSRGSSYDYQNWTNRIEQIRHEIDYEKRLTSNQIDRIKDKYSVD
jgi:hypothetical protein